MATPIERLTDEAAALDQRIAQLEALVLAELTPATRTLYRELDDLRFDRSCCELG